MPPEAPAADATLSDVLDNDADVSVDSSSGSSPAAAAALSGEPATALGETSQAAAAPTASRQPPSLPANAEAAAAAPGQPNGQPPADAARQRAAFLADYLRGQGVDLPFQEYGETDADLLRGLARDAQAARQRNQFAEFGQQVMPYAETFREFMAERQRKAQEARQEKPKDPWGRPEFDDRWLFAVERDPETGEIKRRPGVDAPPDVVSRVQEYYASRQKFADDFYRDPAKLLAPVAQQLRQQILNDIKSTFTQRDAYSRAQQIVEAGRNRLFDPQRPNVLSAEGRRWFEYVKAATESGVSDPDRQAEFAWRCLDGDRWRAFQAAQRQQQQTVSENAFATTTNPVNPAMRAPSVSAAASPGPAADTADQNLSLGERFRRNLERAGGVLTFEHE